MEKKKINIKEFLKKGNPSMLCSGCWDLDELEEYLNACETKKIKDKKEKKISDKTYSRK